MEAPILQSSKAHFLKGLLSFSDGLCKVFTVFLKKEEVHCIMFEIIKNISLEFLVYGMRLIQ